MLSSEEGKSRFLIANKCLDSRIKSREPSMLSKLDLEKAYDHVNWGLLLYMVRRRVFGVKWWPHG
jgi:hypothetical protein